MAATDSAAIFSVLRGSSIDRRLARTLEGESGFNDPVAIVLVLGFIEYIQQPDYGVPDMVAAVRWRSSGSARSSGLAVGDSRCVALPRARSFGTTGLYPVASIATAALAFGAADVLHGSGFMAVYLTGLTLGSAAIPSRRTIDDFHDGLAWVSQIVVFLTLGLLVIPSEFGDIAGEALLIAAVLMFVARPLAAASGHGRRPHQPARVGAGRLGGAARRRADRARHLPGDRGHRRRRARSSTSSSSWSSPRR